MSSPANLHKNIAAGLYKPPEMRYNIPAGRLFAAKIPPAVHCSGGGQGGGQRNGGKRRNRKKYVNKDTIIQRELYHA